MHIALCTTSFHVARLTTNYDMTTCVTFYRRYDVDGKL